MRQMSDLDILVNPYAFGTIKAAMEGIGYYGGANEPPGKHDSFRKKEVHFELHKRLTDESGGIRQWEDGIWDRALPTGHDHILRMCPKDFCIFHFIHLHKVFVSGTLGLRRIADAWRLQK